MIITILRSLCLAAGSLLAASGLFAQPSAPHVAFPAPSPAATIKQRVGLTDIEVVYSRPSAKGRELFGQLVPFGQVWRTGANSATKISFSTPVKLNGTEIPAGHYELFTIPGREEWTIIIHQDVSEWGAFTYDAKKDVARVIAKPVALAEPVESFTIDFNDLRDDSATLNLIWGRTRVPVKIEVDLTSVLVPQIEAVMASNAAKKPYAQAAMFYFDHDLDLKKATAWIDHAVAAQPDGYYLIYQQARILAKAGDKAGAIAAAQKSIALAKKVGGAAQDEYLRLNEALLATLRE